MWNGKRQAFHDMKHIGGVEVYLHQFLASALVGKSDKLYARPLYHQHRMPLPTEDGSFEFFIHVIMFLKNRNLPRPELDPRNFQPVARYCTVKFTQGTNDKGETSNRQQAFLFLVQVDANLRGFCAPTLSGEGRSASRSGHTVFPSANETR